MNDGVRKEVEEATLDVRQEVRRAQKRGVVFLIQDVLVADLVVELTDLGLTTKEGAEVHYLDGALTIPRVVEDATLHVTGKRSTLASALVSRLEAFCIENWDLLTRAAAMPKNGGPSPKPSENP